MPFSFPSLFQSCVMTSPEWCGHRAAPPCAAATGHLQLLRVLVSSPLGQAAPVRTLASASRVLPHKFAELRRASVHTNQLLKGGLVIL